MKGTRTFIINNKKLELPLFEKGDRVTPSYDTDTEIKVEGTVKETWNGGLFVEVDWDQEIYKTKSGGTCEYGCSRIVDDLTLINQQV